MMSDNDDLPVTPPPTGGNEPSPSGSGGETAPAQGGNDGEPVQGGHEGQAANGGERPRELGPDGQPRKRRRRRRRGPRPAGESVAGQLGTAAPGAAQAVPDGELQGEMAAGNTGSGERLGADGRPILTLPHPVQVPGEPALGPDGQPRKRRRRRRRGPRPEGVAGVPNAEGTAVAPATAGEAQVAGGEAVPVRIRPPVMGPHLPRSLRPRRPRRERPAGEVAPREGQQADRPPRERKPGERQPREGQARDGQRRDRPPRADRPPRSDRPAREGGAPSTDRPREARGDRPNRDRTGPGGDKRGPRPGGKPGFGGRDRDRGRDDTRRKPDQKLYTVESVIDRGFEEQPDPANEGQTRRVDWTIVKRTVADQVKAKAVSAVYYVKREDGGSEFPTLALARAAVNKTIVHPEKLTRAKGDYPTTKK